MGLRAWLDRQDDRTGFAPAPALRASGTVVLTLPLLAVLVLATPVNAQRTASGHASVQVTEVSELGVYADGSTTPLASESATGTETERVKVQVRANHGWKVVLAVGYDAAESVWVRTLEPRGTSGYQEVMPGTEAVVATGSGGEVVVEMELRWDAAAYPDVSAIPLTYTLASSDS